MGPKQQKMVYSNHQQTKIWWDRSGVLSTNTKNMDMLNQPSWESSWNPSFTAFHVQKCWDAPNANINGIYRIYIIIYIYVTVRYEFRMF